MTASTRQGLRTWMIRGATHAIALVAGAALGSVLALHYAERTSLLFADMADVDHDSQYLSLAFALGDITSYKTALEDRVSRLEGRRERGGPLSDQRVIASDLAYTHTRLALLAEQLRNEETAQRHMERALGQCAAAFGKPCDAAELKRLVRWLDERRQQHMSAPPREPK